MPQSDKPLIALQRAAERYGLCPETLRNWCRRGHVKAQKRWVFGMSTEIWVIERQSLEEFLRKAKENLEEMEV